VFLLVQYGYIVKQEPRTLISTKPGLSKPPYQDTKTTIYQAATTNRCDPQNNVQVLPDPIVPTDRHKC